MILLREYSIETKSPISFFVLLYTYKARSSNVTHFWFDPTDVDQTTIWGMCLPSSNTSFIGISPVILTDWLSSGDLRSFDSSTHAWTINITA